MLEYKSYSLDKRQKRSRKRENEDQGDITWINEKNRMFNKKLARYYDDVTKETRDNFERGESIILQTHPLFPRASLSSKLTIIRDEKFLGTAL
jgi:hypothetical protein